MRALLIAVLAVSQVACAQFTGTGTGTVTGTGTIGGTNGTVCGPPTYNCTRIDLANAPLPAAIPSVGGLTGTNTLITDTLGNGNQIVRVTDAGFDPSLPNKEFVTASSGSGDMNLFSRAFGSHYLMCLQNSGTSSYAVDINRSTMQIVRPYAATYPATGGIRMSNGTCSWGFTSNKSFFTPASILVSWDFTDWVSGAHTTPPVAVNEFDYTELSTGLPNFGAGNCLPAGYASPTWVDDTSSSADDQTFASGFSISGGQGTGVRVAAYRVGSGCSTLDTSTGAVTGDWGSTGTATMPVASFTVHNQKLSKDGKYLIITCTDSGSGCAGSPFFWQIGTLNVSTSGSDDGGHYTEGYSTWVNGNNTPAAQMKARSFATHGAAAIISSFPAGVAYPFDLHAGWNNVDALDTNPFLMTAYQPYSTGPFKGAVAGLVSVSGTAVTWTSGHVFDTGWTGSIQIGGASYTISAVPSTTSITLSASAPTSASTSFTYSATGYFAWPGEILSVSPVTGVVHRFGQCLSTGTDAHIFDAEFCIGSVSQDGKLFAFTSNWLGTLGSSAGATSCVSTTTCRSDDFVIALN